MPNRCVAGGCSNVPDPSQNIGLHKFPEDNDLEKKRRRLWVAFVRTKRAKWSPTANSRLCSQHFQTEDFESPFVTIPGTDFVSRSVLRKGAVPSIHKTPEPSNYDKHGQSQDSVDPTHPSSTRKHRRAVRELLKENVAKTSEAEASTSTTSTTDEPGLVDDQTVTSDSLYPVQQPLSTEEASCQTPECLGCKKLKSQNRQLCNKIIDLKLKIQVKEAAIQKQKESIDESMAKVAAMEEKLEDETFVSSDEEMDIEEEPDYSEVSSPEHSLASGTESAPEADLSESDLSSDDEEPQVIKTPDNSENLRTEPKFIVFLSQLLLLFNVCPACKSEKPFIETSVLGTMVKITTKCFNPDCSSPENTWKSQPIMTGTKMPAMNFLLCFSVLVSGASPSKIFLVFKNVGLSCISLKTYFKHQANKLFPTVHLYWKKYQEKMMAKLKATEQSLVIAGDGRHDSMGHSAKYCAYTLFCCTVPLIIDFSLVQRNIAGNSPAMELLGFKNCMDSLLVWGILFETFITDRHTGIAKHMRENLAHIKHYFDLWHLKKKIHKVLTKISKEKECEDLTIWIKPCENHLMWSATSTPSGDGELIWAKFESFLSHLVNKHSNLPNGIFNKCAHGEEISDRKWLEEETTVYEKVCKVLKKTSLVKGIKKASPVAQTSCLEGFHSVVNQFAPKMIAYSYQGLYCRHIIAAVHFNHNLHRKNQENKDGSEQIKVVYPKFKNGEATVRNVKVKPNYDYVEEIFNMFIDAKQNKKLEAARLELQAMTPAPMNTMLEKQPRDKATELWKKRKSMVVQEVPKTVQVNESSMTQTVLRKPRYCRSCKNPMKGHKNVKDCPKNM